MQSLAIIFVSVLFAVLYGILHDQVTARICIEYFTIGHPPIFDTSDPTLLAFGWGILATWWVGLLLGVLLALAARAGGRPKRDVQSLVRPLIVLLAVMAFGAVIAGTLGWALANSGVIFLVGQLADDVPADRHVPYLAVAWAHAASYGVGILGGLVVAARVFCSRRIPQAPSSPEGLAN